MLISILFVIQTLSFMGSTEARAVQAFYEPAECAAYIERNKKYLPANEKYECRPIPLQS